MPNASAAGPMNDTPLSLPSGTVVRVRNLVVFRGQQSSNLTLYIETPTPAADAITVRQEAAELVELHSEFAQRFGIRRALIGICRTQACLEMREIPAEMFHFVRDLDGSWRDEAGERR